MLNFLIVAYQQNQQYNSINSVPMFFSIFIRFSICVQLSMFRNDSISLRVCVDDSKYSVFLGKWIPSKIQVIS